MTHDPMHPAQEPEYPRKAVRCGAKTDHLVLDEAGLGGRWDVKDAPLQAVDEGGGCGGSRMPL
jgi:hypothetical protein